MKNLLLVLIAATTITFASCSKEKKLNKRLDGTWVLNKVDGETDEHIEKYPYLWIFTKDGKEGTLEERISSSSGTEINIYIYVLKGDTKLILKDPDGGTEDSELTILEYSKTDLKLTDDESIIEFVKK